MMTFLSSSLLWHQARSFGRTICQRDRTPSVSSLLFQTTHHRHQHSFSSTSLLAALNEQDEDFLSQALEYARLGFGNTFPNPAVGCILVRQDTNEIIGSGFHPRAGFPHAEVFALLEAAGHVSSGVKAAESIVGGTFDETLQTLTDRYASSSDDDGPKALFGNSLESVPVTAYVTLEPCSHFGRTPPCAESLALSKVDRVVVGFRDPNPRVDGGGVQLLQKAGVQVDMAEEGGKSNAKCAKVVENFVKRITPKEYEDDFKWINGAMRRALRRLAGIKKNENSLAQATWTDKVKASGEESVDALDLNHKWLERLDALLWKEELVNLRLNNAVGKKKLAKRLGERVAEALGAHVAQTVGHTALLFRPGNPRVLDLEKLVEVGEDDEDS